MPGEVRFREAALPVVALAAFRREDCATLAGWLADPALLAMTAPGWEPPVTAAFVEREYFEHGAPGDHFRGAVGGVTVGHLGMRSAGVGAAHLYHVIVDPLLQGRGFGSAMVRAACATAFTERGLHRISLYVFDDNAAAIGCYTRAGFRVEGHHRDTYRQGDHWISSYTMAVLRPDWERER